MARALFPILLWVFLCVFCETITAQINPEEAARQELDRRNIDEEELRQRLQSKGVDIDNLENLEPSEALRVQQIIESTIAEMESEAAQVIVSLPVDTVPPSTTSARPDLEEDKVLDELEEMNKSVTDSLPGKIYGQHLFKNQKLRVYNQSEDIRPSDDYIVGVGDELAVAIWGLSRKDEVLEVKKDGFVSPSRMPRIYLKGFTIEHARSILRDRYAQYYRFESNQFSVALKYARIINVNIFGEVNHYGGFSLPALNTAFNALVAAGGPTDLGSVRKIRVIRGKDIQNLDVYKYISDPTVEADYYLQNNDIIQVPVADFVVDVRGAVSRPFKYELLPGEGLMEAIQFAGGLMDNALKSRIKVLRYVDDQQVLVDVNYADLKLKGANEPLVHGDIILVEKISVSQRNVVTVSGAVDYPGTYDVTTDNRLSILLPKIGLNEASRKDVAFLKRINPDSTYSFRKLDFTPVINGQDDIVLSSGDELIVYALSAFTETPRFEIEGAVRNPSSFEYNYRERIRVLDAILLAGGLKEDAQDFAYITRTDSADITRKIYVRVDLEEAQKDPASASNMEIEANDVLSVGSVLGNQVERYIDISGAVSIPGRYDFGEGMTLKDALLLSGGLTFNAAANRIDIFRIVIEENQPTRTVVATTQVDRMLNIDGNAGFELQPFDKIVVREVPQFEFQQNVSIKGEITYPGQYSLTGDNEKLASVIMRAGGLTPEAFAAGATLYRKQDSIGYVVIDLEEALANSNSRNNILLKQGDIIEIPKQIDLVRITGYTNARELYPEKILTKEGGIAVPFNAGKNAKYYIEEFAAGVSDQGDATQITVEHANGQIERVRNFGLFKIYPPVKKGSVIRVGRKVESEESKRKKEEKEDVDWGKIFANSVAQATTILSLILLLQRID